MCRNVRLKLSHWHLPLRTRQALCLQAALPPSADFSKPYQGGIAYEQDFNSFTPAPLEGTTPVDSSSKCLTSLGSTLSEPVLMLARGTKKNLVASRACMLDIMFISSTASQSQFDNLPLTIAPERPVCRSII